MSNRPRYPAKSRKATTGRKVPMCRVCGRSDIRRRANGTYYAHRDSGLQPCDGTDTEPTMGLEMQTLKLAKGKGTRL